jgi:hypothetical protein
MTDDMIRKLVQDLTKLAREGRLNTNQLKALSLLSSEQEGVTGAIPDGRSAVTLDVSALAGKGPSERKLRICLDFGTAMSKAWATGRDEREALPLMLGIPAGIGNSLAVPSSVYVSAGGQIYIGPDADRQFRQDLQPGRLKFDNLKRMLSEAEVGSDLDTLPLRPGVDPSDSGLTQGDFLVLYLAWLTDMSLKALAHVAASLSISRKPLRLAARRFAIPCFEDAVDELKDGRERAKWAFLTMSRAILRAQLVADTLSDVWSRLTVDIAKEVLWQARQIDTGRLRHLLSQDASVREPVAAGASRFNDQISEQRGGGSSKKPVRRFLMVIDAGAGTTDFAVFQVIDRQEVGEPLEYSLISPSVRCAA